jgi:hypothetical protein
MVRHLGTWRNRVRAVVKESGARACASGRSAGRTIGRVQLVIYAAVVSAMGILPANASTYAPVQKVCPVGGEKFQFMELASISQWGGMPDGMPLGSGYFPIQSPKCPGNELVMYRDFMPTEVKVLTAFVGSPEYLALRTAHETPYYLAYRTAKALGDKTAPGLLLQSTWEAKNADPASERARRYDEEFVSLVRTLPVDGASFESIALRARAANALRELGHFEEAEAMRAAITIAPAAGEPEANASQNREGWASYLKSLAAPIERKDQRRDPIDMIGNREAVFRCLSQAVAAKYKRPAPAPLSAFETGYCARPELSTEIAEEKIRLAN